MRTQTVESVEEPKYSEWSPPVVLVTQVPTGAPHSLGIEGRQVWVGGTGAWERRATFADQTFADDGL
jgi:hypothetical protein